MRAYTSCDCHNAHLLPLLNLQDLLSKELLRRRLGALRVVPRDLLANVGGALTQEIGDKPELPNEIFNHPLDVGVGLEGIIVPSHVTQNGSVIVLPSMQSMSHAEPSLPIDQEMERNANGDILL